MNKQRLFLASCVALIATAMSFAIRGDIMGQVQGDLHLTDVQVGGFSAPHSGASVPRSSLAGRSVICWAWVRSCGSRQPGTSSASSSRLPRRTSPSSSSHRRRRDRQRPCRSGRQSAHCDHLLRQQDSEADDVARVVPRRIVIGGVLAFAFTQLGWAGTRRRSCCSCRRSSISGSSSARPSRPRSGKRRACRLGTCSRKRCGRCSSSCGCACGSPRPLSSARAAGSRRSSTA